MKLRTYVRNTGTSGRSACQSVPCGTFSSSTMIVIRIAITPSLNASRRVRDIEAQFISFGARVALRRVVSVEQLSQNVPGTERAASTCRGGAPTSQGSDRYAKHEGLAASGARV